MSLENRESGAEEVFIERGDVDGMNSYSYNNTVELLKDSSLRVLSHVNLPICFSCSSQALLRYLRYSGVDVSSQAQSGRNGRPNQSLRLGVRIRDSSQLGGSHTEISRRIYLIISK